MKCEEGAVMCCDVGNNFLAEQTITDLSALTD